MTGTVKLRPALFPSSLGTRAVRPACLSTWLLSLGAVPIPLICLLFSCEDLCGKRRKGGGWVELEVKMERIFSHVSLIIPLETWMMGF